MHMATVVRVAMRSAGRGVDSYTVYFVFFTDGKTLGALHFNKTELIICSPVNNLSFYTKDSTQQFGKA